MNMCKTLEMARIELEKMKEDSMALHIQERMLPLQVALDCIAECAAQMRKEGGMMTACDTGQD